MRSVASLHDEAMVRAEAKEFAQAFALEVEAAELADKRDVSLTSLVILWRSAAYLAKSAMSQSTADRG